MTIDPERLQAAFDFTPQKKKTPSTSKPRKPRFDEKKRAEVLARSFRINREMDSLLHMAEANKLGIPYHKHRCRLTCCTKSLPPAEE